MKLTYEQVRDSLQTQSMYRVQAGRYYVALSLAEAEALRGIIHMANNSNQPETWLPGTSTTLALRALGSRGTVLDKTPGFVSGIKYQGMMALQCMRYLDSETQYKDNELAMLRRALQASPNESRRNFFVDVSACRRRQKLPVLEQPVARIFSSIDELKNLRQRALASRIKNAIWSKGLRLADAFLLFDYDGDGVLSPAELYGGLDWLGLGLIPAEVKDLIATVDADGDGSITVKELKAALLVPGDREEEVESLLEDHTDSNPGGLASFMSEKIEPKAVTKEEEARMEEMADPGGLPPPCAVPRRVITKFMAKMVNVPKLDKLWTSAGTLAATKASIWRMNTGLMAIGLNKTLSRRDELVCLGHFSRPDLIEPKVWTMELRDRSVLAIQSSTYLTKVKERVFPTPRRFLKAWSHEKGRTPLYVWEAIPPTNDYAALGMVMTEGPEPPPVDEMRCVPKYWCREVSEKPRLIWSDAGAGGVPGGIYTVNSHGLLGVSADNNPPSGPFYELRREFRGSHSFAIFSALDSSAVAKQFILG